MPDPILPNRPALPPPVGQALPPVHPWTWQQPPWYPPDPEPAEPAVPLTHYLWILRRHRWKILSFVAVSVLATFIVSSRLTPIYESTATVDVDRRMPMGILGQEAMQAPTQDADQFLATQVKLIQSDSVLRPVVRRFKLKTEAAEDAAKKPYAEDAPVKLRNLKVTRPPNTYLLLISFRSPDPRLAADVSNAIAQSYIEHTFNIRYRASAGLSTFMEKQTEELRAKMERSAAALAQFERELGVVNTEEKTNILSARLLQLNTEYTNAQAERVRKEAAANSLRGGSFDAALASSQGEVLKKLTERLSEAQQKFAQAKVQYGANHPEYRRASSQVAELERQLDTTVKSILRQADIEYMQAVNREAMLKKAVAETKAESDRLNARSYEYQNLKREAEADKKLYDELNAKIKEAGINSGFQNNAIRLADSARPALAPVFPNLKLNLVLAFLFSGLLAVGAAVLSDVLDNTIRDPEQVQRTLGAEVVGSLPLVKEWQKRPALLGPQTSVLGRDRKEAVLSLVPATDPPSRAAAGFQEAIQTLRNSILLGQFDRPLKSLLVTSAGPGEGKTTTAVHLAMAHARQKHKTLLIDGDLRRPGVARTLGLDGSHGLSTALSNGMLWRDKLVKLESLPDLDILAAGAVSRRSIDLLGPQLHLLLEEAGSEYDMVILDAPPLLGFPEPLQMAAAVDGVVVVSLAGQTNRRAVASVLNTLQRVRANIVGLVLNEVSRDHAGSYYYYGYYGKYHKYYRSSNDAADANG